MGDRRITISISKDGGRNFLYQREATLGELGQYNRPVVVRRFGTARDFRAKFRITSPICVDFMGGTVKYEVGDA